MRLIWISNKITLRTPNQLTIKPSDWYRSDGALPWRQELGISSEAIALPIYYANTRLPKDGPIGHDEVRDGFRGPEKGPWTRYMNEINLFKSAIEASKSESVFFLTKSEGMLRVFAPVASKVFQLLDNEHLGLPFNDEDGDATKRVNVKYCLVKELTSDITRDIRNIPPVLATITNNQHIARSTIVQLFDSSCESSESSWRYGHNAFAFCAYALRSMHSALSEDELESLKESARLIDRACGFSASRWMLLSSTQLETLVAKIFECLGYHVSGYRAGSTDGYDLLVSKMAGRPMLELDLLPRNLINEFGRALIQVKREKVGEQLVDEKIFHVYGKTHSNQKLATNEIGKTFFDSALNHCADVRDWLELETDWFEIPG